MRKVLNSIQMDGVVVIGEGEKDDVSLYFVAVVPWISLFCHLVWLR